MSETSSISRLQELLPQLFQSTNLPGDAYVRFQLTPEVAALISMAYVQESSLVSADSITPIPNMPPFTLGLMNSQERVFLAIDLAQLLGLSSPSGYARQYHIIVVRVSQLIETEAASERELLLGLVVNRVEGMTRVMSDVIRSPQSDLPPTLTPYIQGCAVDKDLYLPIIDISSIVKKALE